MSPHRPTTMLGIAARRSTAAENAPASRAGANSARNAAAPSPTGMTSSIATAVVTIVPTTRIPAPNSLAAGFQVPDQMKPIPERPNAWLAVVRHDDHEADEERGEQSRRHPARRGVDAAAGSTPPAHERLTCSEGGIRCAQRPRQLVAHREITQRSGGKDLLARRVLQTLDVQHRRAVERSPAGARSREQRRHAGPW